MLDDSAPPILSSTPSDMQILLQQSKSEAVLVVLPALYAASGAIFVCCGQFANPYQGALITLLLCALLVATWLLHHWHTLVAAWFLSVGCIAVTLLLINWGNLPAAVFLLIVPTGLAGLTVSTWGCAIVGAGCTLLLLFAPGTIASADGSVRFMAGVGIWNTVGLVWLTRRPMLTALEWSWSGYEQNRRLLEQARDYRMQLKQTVADLADANLQLTRLNQLAQGLRQAAEEARQAKEQFVANVSHELHTPLNMIIGFSEMIVRAPQVYGSRIPPALLADLAIILRNSQHLSSLIDDVLDLSQIETGKMALTKERVELAEIVQAATTAVRPLFESKRLYLKTDLPQGLPSIVCDRTRMREVVLNLLSNAGRFTQEGGVVLRVRQENDGIVLSVTDSGPGISAEDMDRLFQPFQQLDGSIRRQYGGTGLGLAISKSIVEMHGGKMWLESQLGVGSTFHIRLPIELTQPAGSAVSRWFNPHWHYEERTRRSLAPAAVVQPRFVVWEAGTSLQRLLGRYMDGTEVVPVSDLDQAVEELLRVPAQGLLVNTPAMVDALHEVQSTGGLPHGAPAIVCSVPGALEAASALAVSDYLVKPVARDALLAALERLGLQGRTVLVIDDESEAARLFQRMLATVEPPYRVLRAGTGREGLKILREQHVDAILLDLVMPEMDGFQFLEVRSQDPELRDIPVVVTSARDPGGQPIVTSSLAVTRSDGLSVPQLLACIEAISQILTPGARSADPALPEKPPA